MSRKRKPMRQIKEVLRLRQEHHLSVRELARSCGLPASTVGDYLKRAAAAGLSWPLPEELDDEQLGRKLLAVGELPLAASSGPPTPDWPRLHEELRRKGVTLRLLWQEYRQNHPEGYGYSRYCQLYEAWAKTLEPTLRQVHAPGDKLFVDWAGLTVPVQNPADGTIRPAYVFVAVLGASNLTYVEAFPDMRLASWIAAHVRALAFFGGAPRLLVPDNAKTAVTLASRYEPILHRSYQEMAEHYGAVVLPARPRKPRDKAKVEAGVQVAERRILAVLRDRVFFSVAELNQAMRPLQDQLNAQPFQILPGSRDQCFQEQEKAALRPLPSAPFAMAVWLEAKANIDYHVVVDKHFYSVPHRLVQQKIDVRLTETTVELFHQGKRVAAHARSRQPGSATTLEEHRPKSHQKHLQWTKERMLAWAETIGPHCRRAVGQILEAFPHPEQGYRSCLGLIRVSRGAGAARMDAACRRALHFGTCTYRSIQSILQNGLDHQPLEPELPLASPAHDNVRGGSYYA
jgi:transposase